MPNSWPDPETAADLYRRLCAGDRLAQSEFLEAVLDPLAGDLRRWHRGADEHACITAAEDAVLALLHNPTIYDPAKRGLIGFLRMAAECDLLNALQREKKHHANREHRDCVELPERGGNSVTDGPADALPSFDAPGVAAEIAGFTAPERAVFELMRSGERRTSAFAAVLGIEHLTADEQAGEVKRVKDRIIKRLQRAGSKT